MSRFEMQFTVCVIVADMHRSLKPRSSRSPRACSTSNYVWCRNCCWWSPMCGLSNAIGGNLRQQSSVRFPPGARHIHIILHLKNATSRVVSRQAPGVSYRRPQRTDSPGADLVSKISPGRLPPKKAGHLQSRWSSGRWCVSNFSKRPRSGNDRPIGRRIGWGRTTKLWGCLNWRQLRNLHTAVEMSTHRRSQSSIY